MRLTLSPQLREMGGEVTSQNISVLLKLIHSGLGEAGGVAGTWNPHQATGVLIAGDLQLQVTLSGFCPGLWTLWRDRELNSTWHHSPASPAATATDLPFKCWFLQNAQACLRSVTLSGTKLGCLKIVSPPVPPAQQDAGRLCFQGRARGGSCTQSRVSGSAKPCSYKLCVASALHPGNF